MFKKMFSVPILAMFLVSTITCFAYAKEVDFALFVEDSVEFNNTDNAVSGNVVTGVNCDDIEGIGKKDSVTNGLLYVNNEKSRDELSKVSYLAEEKFPLEMPSELKELKVIKAPNHITGSFENEITSDVGVKNLSTKEDLKIIAPQDKTITVVADSIDFNHDVIVEGSGIVNFYTKDLNVKSKVKINSNGNAVVNFFVSGDEVDLGNKSTGKFNIYAPNAEIETDNNIIYGNIYTNEELDFSGNVEIYGFVYCSDSEINLSGNSTIYGKVMTESIDFSGNSYIEYADVDYEFVGGSDNEEPTPPTPEEPAKPEQPEGDLSDLKFSYAYIYGYGWGDVGANDNLTREEVSAVVYRLLKQNNLTGGFVKPKTPTFSDVEKNRWSYSAIEYLTSKGIFDKNAGIVKPNEVITRGEMAKILNLAFNLDIKNVDVKTFSDLPEENNYYEYAIPLIERGIMQGDSNGNLSLDSNLKRCQFIKMINTLTGRDYDVSGLENPFPDLDDEHWAYEEILRATYGFDENGKKDDSKKPSRETIDYD